MSWKLLLAGDGEIPNERFRPLETKCLSMGTNSRGLESEESWRSISGAWRSSGDAGGSQISRESKVLTKTVKLTDKDQTLQLLPFLGALRSNS